MEKILISACFLGHNVRYNGEIKPLHHQVIVKWQQQQRLVVICPEVAGGLSTPRLAAEQQPNGRVLARNGQDVSDAFAEGAQKALTLCQQHHIRFALLKESSPSCGRHQIHNGSFTGTKIVGAGVTTQLLLANGIEVFSEHELPQLIAALGDV